MTPQQKQVNQYLHKFGKQVHAPFTLKNGVCALLLLDFAQGRL